MQNWNGKTADGQFTVNISSSVRCTWERYCRVAGEFETGGILIGRYSDDLSQASVIEATPPPSDSRHGYSWFVRGVNGLESMLVERWQTTDRTYYIGEWHSHPSKSVVPGKNDVEQIVKISHTKNYDCKNPILCILDRSDDAKGFHTIHVFVFAEDKPIRVFPETGIQ